MKYQVLWTAEAEADLLDLWQRSVTPKVLMDAARAVERRLASDPWGSSESRDDDKRILVHPPLAVIFRIVEPNAQVFVASVWDFYKRK